MGTVSHFLRFKTNTREYELGILFFSSKTKTLKLNLIFLCFLVRFKTSLSFTLMDFLLPFFHTKCDIFKKNCFVLFLYDLFSWEEF